jgi:hypothetical protein
VFSDKKAFNSEKAITYDIVIIEGPKTMEIKKQIIADINQNLS